MSTKAITRERLAHLLRVWGTWESAGRLGPKNDYHTMDREYARFSSRSTVPQGTTDDPDLAEITEQAILALPKQQQRVLVLIYARRFTVLDVAEILRMSRVSAEALLDTAIVAVWSELEAML